jgi:hypothetical protein
MKLLVISAALILSGSAASRTTRLARHCLARRDAVTTVIPWEERVSVGERMGRARLRTLAMTAGLLIMIGGVSAVFPRHPDLRAFDPAIMAHSETMMWRHYYERRYLSLFADLYDNSRTLPGIASRSPPWQPRRPVPFRVCPGTS